MWGLTILGGLLIAGMFTRVAALGAAVLVFQFYMAYPPIPGYPEVPGPEHALIVNKNLIEVFVLVAFVFLPSGCWFGVDSIFAIIFAGKKVK
jgi:thiosulfate dehydrogenase [quinone] large subunit